MLMIEQIYQPISCLQWFPWCSNVGNNTRSTLLLGTNSASQARNYLCILSVHLPAPSGETEQITVQQKVNHAGPVCHASYNPSDPWFVATAAVTGDVLIFDLYRSPREPPRDGRCLPATRLACHTAACRSVAWSPHEEGILLSGSVDGRLCVWDIIDKDAKPHHPEKELRQPSGVKPLRTFEHAHGGGVNAAAFHPEHQHTFSSAGGDGRFCVWDCRVDDGSWRKPMAQAKRRTEGYLSVGDSRVSDGSWRKSVRPESVAGRSWENSLAATGVATPVLATDAHAGGALALAFGPRARTLVATGGKDRMVRVWDLRQPRVALEGLAGHTCDVLAVDWAQEEPGLLASSSSDKRVLLWDPLRAGCWVDEEVDRFHLRVRGKPEPFRSACYKSVAEAADSTSGGKYDRYRTSKYAPELAGLHMAHDATVSSVAWGHGQEGNLLASADAGGFLHVWQPSEDMMREGRSLTGEFDPLGRKLWDSN